MRRSPVFCCLVVCFCLVSALMGYCQSASTATLRGRVVDPQEAVVPNATVTATNTATGMNRSVGTTSAGDYVIPNLPPGTYNISVQAKGFANNESKGLLLNVGDQRDLNFKLSISGTSTSVEVTTVAPLIETTKTDVSTTVNDLDMKRLPVFAGAGGVANDYAQLALSAPGVKLDTSTLTGPAGQGDLVGPGSTNDRGNLYNVDGANITDQLVSGRAGGVGASVDEIQEFQVLTNNYNAEYGQAGGLVINAVTKSGTNSIHGDYHSYFRGRNLTASNAFYNLSLLPGPIDGARRAPFHREEDGFTLGGPFIKDRLFWFTSLESSRQSAPLILTPPTGALTLQQPVNDLLYSGKIDWKVSNNHSLSVRYNVDRQLLNNLVVQTSNNITPDDLTENNIHSAGLNVGFVSSITPTLVNEARFFFYRTVNTLPDKTSQPGQLHANFSSGANFCCPQGGLNKRYQYMDNLTWTHGTHTFKTGFNISYYPWFSLFQQFHFGQYADFVGANPTTFTIGFGPGQVKSKDNIYGFYFQDTWKLARNFTVNAGIRYDAEAGAFKGGTIKGPNGTCFEGNGIISACSSDHNNFQPRLGFTWSPWGEKTLFKASFAETTQLAFNNVVLDSLNFDGTTLTTVTIDNSTPAGQAVLAAFPNAPSQALLAPFAPHGAPFGRVRPISPNLKNPEIRSFNAAIQHEFTKTLVAEVQYIGQFGFGLFGERDTNFPAIIADPAHPGFFYFGSRPDNRFTAVRTNENSRTSHYNGLLVSATKRFSNHVQFIASYTWSHALTSGEDFFGLSEPGDPRNIRSELGPAFNDVRHAANFNVVLESGKVTDMPVARVFTNGLTLSFLGQAQSGRPYPISTGTAGFSNARFFGAGSETQQRPNVLADGTLSTAGIASFTGSNALFGPGAVGNCIAAGFPAATCAAIQNTFLAPAGHSNSGAIDALTGDIVDFQLLDGNLGRDAGRGSPFYKLDVSLHKDFKIPRTERVSVELRADAFNILNHANFQSYNSNDVLNALSFSANGAGIPNGNFFTCTSCVRPNGTLVGSNGQVLHLTDLQRGRVSPDLLNPIFGGLGDPATADIPRTFQLSFHVRF
ncbi:MAG TPA: TonB-dependent receptor [Candidatus Angelobacter sp.]|nr:TonB-dependent receptor [Candidatus Angelobacter sp.]